MRLVTASLCAVVGFVTFMGCHAVVPAPPAPVVVHQPGPPSHAPAHGHRRKHESGVELRFDSRLDVYVVLGHTDLYFHDGAFIRFRNGTWQVSASLGGPWEYKPAGWVPPGLRAKHHARAGKQRGSHPAKGSW